MKDLTVLKSSKNIYSETLPAFAISLILLIISAGCSDQQDSSLAEYGPSSEARHLVIIVDGLRPDYVTPEIMPHVYAMGQKGVIGTNSYSVFPSFTRPNRTAIPTGVYPHKHGIVNNSMLHPDLEEPVHTGNYQDMHAYAEVSGTPIITSVTIGEVLDANGMNILTLGHGSWLQNYKNLGKGWMMAGNFSQPEDIVAEIIAAVGEAPAGGRTSERTAWEIDLYLYDSLGDNPAEVVLLWLGEPDAAGHEFGVGAPETLEAVASVDRQIGRILQVHEEHGLSEEVNIYITSDHGFTQSTGNFSVAEFVRNAGLEGQVEFVRNMGYVPDSNPEQMKRMVEALHRSDEVGAVYTRPANPGDEEGMIPGTLSTDLIMWTHDRGSDIIISPSWSDDKNEHGWKGVTSRSGLASHGSDSPFDMNIAFVAAGPDIKQGVVNDVPTGNVDFAPTVLHLLGINPPDHMDGRIMTEILKTGPQPDEIEVERLTHPVSVTYSDGFTYQTELTRFRVDSTYYIRKAVTERKQP
ncbi:MAG: alkaline phosphatase family protein [Balneolaceae bacterium]|nr:MAG: alkaline phosphatase family protein [Balneolaceae bacterium]